MKRRGVQTFLLIIISSFILVFSTYQRFSNLAEVNLFRTDLTFENADQGDQLSNYLQDESKVFASSIVFIIFPQTKNHFGQTLYFSFSTSFFDQKTSVLRC